MISKESKANHFAAFDQNRCLTHSFSPTAQCTVLHLCQQGGSCAVPPKWMQITGFFMHGHGQECTAPDLKDPASQTSQDKSGEVSQPF